MYNRRGRRTEQTINTQSYLIEKNVPFEGEGEIETDNVVGEIVPSGINRAHKVRGQMVVCMYLWVVERA